MSTLFSLFILIALGFGGKLLEKLQKGLDKVGNEMSTPHTSQEPSTASAEEDFDWREVMTDDASETFEAYEADEESARDFDVLGQEIESYENSTIADEPLAPSAVALAVEEDEGTASEVFDLRQAVIYQTILQRKYV